MSNNFRVGQKVVHVPYWGGKYNNREIGPLSVLQWPEPNGVYTIREIIEGYNPCAKAFELGLKLEEIPDQIIPYGDWKGCQFNFNTSEFRPLSFLDTDISIFTKMLDKELV